MTRRTALRGAAWTASAVTIVVATPDIASASTGAPPSIGLAPQRAVRSTRDANTNLVTWQLAITVGSSITSLSVSFTGVSAVTGLQVECATGPWSGNGNSTRVFNSPLRAGDVLDVTATFTRSSNGKDELVTATFVTGTPPITLASCSSPID